MGDGQVKALLEDLGNGSYTFVVFGKIKANAAMLGLTSGLLMSGCSFVVSPQTVQCETQQDCEGMGFSSTVCVDSICVASRDEDPKPDPVKDEPKVVEPRFACKDKVWEQPSQGIVKYDMNVTSLLGSPYQGLTVKVCPAFDTKCEKSQAEATSDANGDFSLNLPVGFRGHLYAPAPEADPELMELEAYVFPPPSLDPAVPKRPGLVVTQLAVIQGLVGIDGANMLPGAGHVIFTAMDCNGKPLEGIEVRTSQTRKETWRVYVGEGGHPDPDLEATGSTGKGAVLNVPPGYVKVIGTHPEYGKIFEQSVIVVENRLTSVPVVPSTVPKG